MKSQPLSISRYSNGTLVKLSVSDSAFVSYDFDPKKNTGTYTPTSITITPTFSGGVKFGSWGYSTDGATFQNIVSGQHGFTINGGAVILAATSDLYATTNSAVIVACVGDDPTYFDTVTIMRYVDPTFVFRQTSTAIKQTNDKISLIATDEQLERYGQNFTALDDLQAQIDVIPSRISLAVKEEHGIITGEMNTALSEYATLEEMESQLELTSQSITSSVSKTYQTKSDSVAALNEAKEYTNNAEQDANDYTDGKVQNVAADLRSEIKQSADNITSTVSATYQTKKAAASDLSAAKAYADEVASDATAIANGKTTAYYQTSAPTGAREGDLWIDTDDGNSLHRYNGSNWITIDNTKIQKALTDAADAQSTADKKIITFAQTSQPTATGVGDLWIDTDDDNKLYRWNGSAWTAYRDGAIAKAETSAKNYADSKDVTLKSEIKQTTDAISSTVSKKVGKDEIISSINQSADRISLTAGRLVITSGNFQLDEYGNVTATGANLSGTLTAGTDTGKKIVIANGVLTGYSAGVKQASLNIADGQFNIIGKLALNGNVGVSGSGSYVKNIEYKTINIPELKPTFATANFVKDFTLSVSGGVLRADDYLNTNTYLTTTMLTYKNSWGTTSYQTVVTGWIKSWSKPSISTVSVSHSNTTGTAVTSTGLQQTFTPYKVPTNITLGKIESKYGIISSMG